jgi:tetratricopeptide (TPR) repeat protein
MDRENMEPPPGHLDTGQALADRGRALYRQGDLEEALSFLHQAHEAYKQEGDLGNIAEASNDLGVLYTVLRRYGEADAWLREAQRCFVEIKDYDGEAQTLGNLGSMYQSQGDLKQAAANLQLAADRFHLVVDDQERPETLQKRSETLKALCMVRLRQFRFLQALAAFEAALACRPRPTILHRLLRRILALPQRIVQR